MGIVERNVFLGRFFSFLSEKLNVLGSVKKAKVFFLGGLLIWVI